MHKECKNNANEWLVVKKISESEVREQGLDVWMNLYIEKKISKYICLGGAKDRKIGQQVFLFLKNRTLPI